MLQSQCSDKKNKQVVFASHPLIARLEQVPLALSNYNFRLTRETNTARASKTYIPEARRKAMMACLFYYDLNISLVMRLLRDNHTTTHRDVQSVAAILLAHKVPTFLVQQYVRVMTSGCPGPINGNVSRKNALQY